MSNLKFIHLHLRTEYSLIDGLGSVDGFIKKAVSFKMPALAITDFTNFFGLIKFYKLSYNYGIKPIIGVDFLVQNDQYNDDLFELTILASDNIGYKNLIKLITKAYKDNYNYKFKVPVINQSLLIKFNYGLILLSGSIKGDLGNYLIKNNLKKVKECLVFYKKYFSNRYYIELTRTDKLHEEYYLKNAVKLSIKYKLPIVATNNVRFINKNDYEAHKIRLSINNKNALTFDKNFCNQYSLNQYMRSEEEMILLFSDLPEALINSVEIARRCNVVICLGNYYLPKYPTGLMSTENYLIKFAKYGLEERLVDLFPKSNELTINRKIYDKRLITELNIINKMKFPSYFLIVMEFVQWSKDNNILVGPGRGSGPGSLVAYVLKITNINPIKFTLLFERFLNLDRISMPDFDIDFCMVKRDFVIEHVVKKYGDSSVSQIITFGTMTAKAVIRDVGRVLGYPYNFVSSIAKLIPRDIGITLKKSFIVSPRLYMFYKSDEDVKNLIDISFKLEGVIRNVSKHAGGVVISPTVINDFTPLYFDCEGNNQVTQFDKDDVEYSGLVKFDFLGLRTLTIIDWTLLKINNKFKLLGLKIINITDISLNDKKSFNLLNKLDTIAVFQLESSGMKDLIKRLKPDCFEDIVALIALFRPGPLQSGMVDNFINRKHGKEIISYPDIKWQHRLLKPILKFTYGIILYQEQVMQIAQVLAGYTLSDADILRHVIGKKKTNEMNKQRLIFKNGSKNIGINTDLSMKIFDIVEKFAGYGFNKSHSTAYALISYQTLWLKSNFPAEFMASAMSSDMDNTNKLVNLMNECLRMNIKILPPDINLSQYDFYVNNDGFVVYGLGAIKGIGKIIIDSIIKSRDYYGKFLTLMDFFIQINFKKFNNRICEKLIFSGVFDSLGINRLLLINFLSISFKNINQYIKNKITGQQDIFGLSIEKLNNNFIINKKDKPWFIDTILKGEYETLGFYLTYHPVTQYLYEIKYYGNIIRIKDINYTKLIDKIFIIGLIESFRVLTTKKGDFICVCTISDNFSKIDIILFRDILEKFRHLLKIGNIIIVQCKLNFNFINNKKIIVNKLIDISYFRVKYIKEISVVLFIDSINNKFLNKFNSLINLNKYHLNICLNFYYKKNNKLVKLLFNEKFKINPTQIMLNKIHMVDIVEDIQFKFK